jgi:tryptophan 7-halogenase
MGIAHLLTFFPAAGFAREDTEQYNRVMAQEYEWVRDFIILHYKATERNDTPFWNYCRTMEIPTSLQHRIDLFKSHGRVYREGSELFMKPSWLQVMHGQRLRPNSYHPLTDLLTEEEIQAYLEEVEGVISACVEVMPTHAQFIADNCAAGKMMMPV